MAFLISRVVAARLLRLLCDEVTAVLVRIRPRPSFATCSPPSLACEISKTPVCLGYTHRWAAEAIHVLPLDDCLAYVLYTLCRDKTYNCRTSLEVLGSRGCVRFPNL